MISAMGVPQHVRKVLNRKVSKLHAAKKNPRTTGNQSDVYSLDVGAWSLAEVDDRWIERQKVPPSRPEAIRRLVEIGAEGEEMTA
jgi:hypothetical protein